MTTVYLSRNRFPALADALRLEVSKAVRSTALAIQADITAGMTAPHTGRIYDGHQASAPGEMPAVDMGTLLGSLDVDAKAGETTATVYVTPEYSLYLEYGAPRANIEPRPFMTPAAEGRRDEFERKVRAALRRLR